MKIMLKFLEKVLIKVVGDIILIILRYIVKIIKKLFKKMIFYFDKLWQRICGIKSSILNKIREKIVGKENLELLKELNILKGNERAIKFLDNFSEEDNDVYKVNIKYEALNAFMELYSITAKTNFYDYPYRLNKGDNLDLNGLRMEIFEKLIKNILNNNNNKNN